jgi:hypothetical protein
MERLWAHAGSKLVSCAVATTPRVSTRSGSGPNVECLFVRPPGAVYPSARWIVFQEHLESDNKILGCGLIPNRTSFKMPDELRINSWSEEKDGSAKREEEGRESCS